MGQWIYWAMGVWAISISPLPCPLFRARCITHPFLHAPICPIHYIPHTHIASYVHCPYAHCLICPLPYIPSTPYPHCPISPLPHTDCLVYAFLHTSHWPIRPLPHMSLLQTPIAGLAQANILCLQFSFETKQRYYCQMSVCNSCCSHSV